MEHHLISRLGSAGAIDAKTVKTRSQFGVMRNSRQGTRERAISMRRAVKRLVLYAVAALVAVALAFGALIVWPKPLFAFSLGPGTPIYVAPERRQEELRRRGLTELASFEAGKGSALLARKGARA